MKVVPISTPTNDDAVLVLEEAIRRVKAGEISSVGLAFVFSDGGIGGEVSNGKDNVMMWAALEHNARDFYIKHISPQGE